LIIRDYIDNDFKELGISVQNGKYGHQVDRVQRSDLSGGKTGIIFHAGPAKGIGLLVGAAGRHI
jgi:hypothetical protein